MSSISKVPKEAIAPKGFDPAAQRYSDPDWSGQRRKLEPAPDVILWRWPGTRAMQLQSFDDWHDVAMQFVHLAKGGFRVMAVYEKVIRWDEGCIWDSDHELAAAAGRCNWKTISRDIGLHRSIGIIQVEHGWRNVSGRTLRTRTIRPAVPSVIPPEIVIRDLTYAPKHTVNRGPYERQLDTVTSGPNHTVTSGPITLVTREEGASRNDSAA